ncbi:Pr6Pr family membrane protein [Kribbella sp. NPDC051770]|uniref:Pr6Pr family membrane protein n=1 Tax=Kribbella sp. NPDC051770 TaxID=3155413 RepID=UPI003425485E
MTRSKVARGWWAAIVAVIVVSLVIQLVLIFTGGADANSGETGASIGVRLWRLVSFFTIESNLIVLAALVFLVRSTSYDGPRWRVLHLDALLGIVITGLVFAIVLAPQVHLTGWALAATIGFHYVSPWATLVGWLVFGPRPRMSWATVGLAFVWPLAWLVYIFVQGSFTDWYPYPFLDVTDLGLGVAVRNAAFVLVLGIALAAGFKTLDAKLPRTG